MKPEQLLEFATQVESFCEDDQWRVATTLVNCAHQDWAITEADKKSFLRTLAEAQKNGLSTAPLAIALELSRRIVPDFWGRGILITGPSDQFPSDISGLWLIKLNGVRLGSASTLMLAFAATICRVIATERNRTMAAEFVRQRQESSADIAALQAQLDQRATERK
jgi:hypothetical protein